MLVVCVQLGVRRATRPSVVLEDDFGLVVSVYIYILVVVERCSWLCVHVGRCSFYFGHEADKERVTRLCSESWIRHTNIAICLPSFATRGVPQIKVGSIYYIYIHKTPAAKRIELYIGMCIFAFYSLSLSLSIFVVTLTVHLTFWHLKFGLVLVWPSTKQFRAIRWSGFGARQAESNAHKRESPLTRYLQIYVCVCVCVLD